MRPSLVLCLAVALVMLRTARAMNEVRLWLTAAAIRLGEDNT